MSFKLVSGSVILVVLLSIIKSSTGVPECTCRKQYDPVCGSDGQVYSNRCLLDCNNSILGSDIQVINKGPCEREAPSDASQCACFRILSPVCGTDNVTYNNICMLRCSRLKKPTLEVQHQGACDDLLKRRKRASLYAKRYGIQRHAPCSFV